MATSEQVDAAAKRLLDKYLKEGREKRGEHARYEDGMADGVLIVTKHYLGMLLSCIGDGLDTGETLYALNELVRGLHEVSTSIQEADPNSPFQIIHH